jgi:hypothetical protein
MKMHERVEVQLHHSRPQHQMDWSASGPSNFTPREIASGTHWMGSWMDLTASLDAVEKSKISRPYHELNSSHLAPTAHHYTKCATMEAIFYKSMSFLHSRKYSQASTSHITLKNVHRPSKFIKQNLH